MTYLGFKKVAKPLETQISQNIQDEVISKVNC